MKKNQSMIRTVNRLKRLYLWIWALNIYINTVSLQFKIKIK